MMHHTTPATLALIITLDQKLRVETDLLPAEASCDRPHDRADPGGAGPPIRKNHLQFWGRFAGAGFSPMAPAARGGLGPKHRNPNQICYLCAT
jgi:hypothetical protein